MQRCIDRRRRLTRGDRNGVGRREGQSAVVPLGGVVAAGSAGVAELDLVAPAGQAAEAEVTARVGLRGGDREREFASARAQCGYADLGNRSARNRILDVTRDVA